MQFSEAARDDDSFIVVVAPMGAAIGLVETEVTIRAQTESGIQLQPVTVPGVVPESAVRRGTQR